MLDLFAIAKANSDTLEQEYRTIMSSRPTDGNGVLLRFVNHVRREGRVSVNTRPMAFISLFTFGSHQNTYEWALTRSQESGRKCRGHHTREAWRLLHETGFV